MCTETELADLVRYGRFCRASSVFARPKYGLTYYMGKQYTYDNTIHTELKRRKCSSLGKKISKNFLSTASLAPRPSFASSSWTRLSDQQETERANLHLFFSFAIFFFLILLKKMPSLTCTKLTVFTIAGVIIQMVGLSLFVFGFFPVKPALSGVRYVLNQLLVWFPRKPKKIVFFFFKKYFTKV